MQIKESAHENQPSLTNSIAPNVQKSKFAHENQSALPLMQSPPTHSSFQPCSKTESANIPKKNRITLEKTTSPNSQEKNTPEFLEENST
jgi:hypothetical protein